MQLENFIDLLPPDHSRVECLPGGAERTQGLLRAASAFANGRGGLIIIGAEKARDGSIAVTGAGDLDPFRA